MSNIINSDKENVFLSGDDLREPIVIIDKGTLNYIKEFAKKDTSKERGGVLVGAVEKLNKQKPKITILGAIEGKYTDASSVSLKFTHETWNSIHEIKEQKYPDSKIVGWFHTHPGLGIFLSHYDLFIHRNFFKEPWQVAIVIDPLNDKMGLFYWEQSDIVEAGAKKKQGISVEEEDVKIKGNKQDFVNVRNPPRWFPSLVSFLSVFLVCVLLFFLILNTPRMEKKLKPQNQNLVSQNKKSLLGNIKEHIKNIKESLQQEIVKYRRNKMTRRSHE
jgi:proteasome lid subunit RPN8/RPN11